MSISRENLALQDSELLYELAEKLTGTCQEGKFRHQVIVTNVRRRMHVVGADTLPQYLAFAADNDGEFQHLISSLTIHTTSWFREAPHFEQLEKDLLSDTAGLEQSNFKALSAACSTGEEAYSLALVLESVRARVPKFNYEIIGSDIDPVSVDKARVARYPLSALSQIPHRFHKFLLKGSGRNEGFFTLTNDIINRCSFKPNNLKEFHTNGNETYDFILCRNVLIYFSPTDVDKIVNKLLGLLTPQGILCLGHSEALDNSKFSVRPLGNARYTAFPNTRSATANSGKEFSGQLTVLIIDDSATMRAMILKLVGRSKLKASAVASASEADTFLKSNKVDLITLDLHMPGTSGQAWLRDQRASGLRTPVVIISGASQSEALDVLGVLESGAQDYVDKSLLKASGDELLERLTALGEQYRTIQARGSNSDKKYARPDAAIFKLHKPDLILVGASTGGTECLVRMLKQLPRDCPPVLVTQHISPAFCEPFAKRLALSAGLDLGSAQDGTLLEVGKLYMALGDYHIGVTNRRGAIVLKISAEAAINRHRPSVDFLFQSAAQLRNSKIFASLMTGMGADGARGLQALQQQGCMTAAQDEESCVVFGMPREAIKLGAAGFIGNPAEIRECLERAINK